MKKNRRLVVLCVAISVIMSMSTVALAIPTDSGSINCGGNYIAVRSCGLGKVRHYVPSSTQVASWDNNTWQHRSNATTISSSSWKVTAGTALAEPTYAFCWGN